MCLLSGREGRRWRGGAERHSALIKGKWPQVDPGLSESLNYTCHLQERKREKMSYLHSCLSFSSRATNGFVAAFAVEWTFLYIVGNVD